MKPLTALLLAPLAACTGNETGVTRLEPTIVVLPESLEFGEVIAGLDQSAELQIKNAGRADLIVASVEVELGDTVFTVAFEEVTLEPDGLYQLDVNFAPQEEGSFTGSLAITSNDEDNLVVDVPLLGVGLPVPAPDIAVSPTSIDFGDVTPGDEETAYLTVTNEGSADLTIDSTALAGSGAFSLSPSLDALVLSAGSAYSTVVTYAPITDYGDSSGLFLYSDDPDEPSVEVELIGNGGGDGSYPVAVIDCPSDVAPGDAVTLDGSGSYDPDGLEPLTYDWSLALQPTGSASTLSADTDSATFSVDMAGRWVASLMVTNTDGVSSAPTRCQFVATPTDNIHVELYWDTTDSDVDLHLMRDDALFFEPPGDACWCNTNPDWGEETETQDDPVLEDDDRAAGGPELAHITSPVDGNYYVRVHYYLDTGGGPTTATVHIYTWGSDSQTFSKVLEENEVWDVAFVRWPYGYVIEESTEVYSAGGTRSCHVAGE